MLPKPHALYVFPLAIQLALGACSSAGSARGQAALLCSGLSTDSARAAQVSLDTVNRVSNFPSVVLRYSRDSAGFRIVTMPDSGRHVLDGMAVVQLTPQCAVVSLILTQSRLSASAT
jgi:hypothetical protein